MISPGELGRRLRMLVQRRRWRRELDEEMRLHRELRSDDRKFGNDLRLLERSQAQWGWTWLETWAQDIRHGLRLLRRTPLITALAVLSLALGIGATTALFTLADAVIFRPLAVSHPEQLVSVTRYKNQDFSPRMYARLRDVDGLFAGLLAASHTGFSLAGSTSFTPGLAVSGSYFATLGLHAERGRLIAPTDDFHNCPAIADISDAYWRGRFLASPRAIGATVQIRGYAFAIVGVTPPGFYGTTVGQNFDLAIPLCDEARAEGNNYGEGWVDTVNLSVLARLWPGETLRQAQARLNAVTTQLAPVLAVQNRRAALPAFAMHVHAAAGGGTSRLRVLLGPTILVLLGVAGLVWLLACANLTALMRARAAAQQPEIAMRLALGATRARLVRQLLTESILLTLGGLALAWPLARWACRAAIAFWSMHGISPTLNLNPDGRVLLFLAGLTLATALCMGLWPALRASDTQLSLTSRQDRPRRALGWHSIAGQLALALVLLAAAGLFARALETLTGPGKGFDARHVWLIEFPRLRHASKLDVAHAIATRQAAVIRLQSMAGVRRAAAALTIPAGWISSVSAMVWPQADAGHWRGVFMNAISPDYFATLRTPMLQGRAFRLSDRDQAVAIINPALAAILFPGGHALRQSFTATIRYPKQQRLRVVGVAANTNDWQLQRPAQPTLYVPLSSDPRFWSAATIFVRSPLSASLLTREARHALGAAGGFQVQSYSALLDQGIKPQLMLAWLAVFFGGLALILAGLGLYGVTAYNTQRRRREFGIRVTLGATERAIRHQVLREAAAALAAALPIGAGLAYLLARAMQTELGKVLYSIHANDVAAWAGAVAVLCATATLASYWPALRAAQADPMNALRED